ncbi:hypothetical protein [Mycobacterium sp. E3305]|uniref:hypothetical protein n=1 Tax=Mycobacterium sp. E3305 TaxID=1834145 RepID=UPI0008000CA2|nr:hypothetical protein [Mycobacterium sp. E3305]OBG70280.1 hypothetical protein A5701_03565 [Mycobacterium sp. E3305]
MTDSQPFDLPELPDKIGPGDFTLVFMDEDEAGEPLGAAEIRFSWDGGPAATFRCDTWDNPADPSFVFEIGSSPVCGVASWLNGEDLFIAFSSRVAEEEGWARIPGGAPASDEEDADDAMLEPATWIELAKKISAVGYDRPLPGMKRETF